MREGCLVSGSSPLCRAARRLHFGDQAIVDFLRALVRRAFAKPGGIGLERRARRDGAELQPPVDMAADITDRKSVVSGQSVSVRVDLGGRRIINTKTKRTLSIL